MNVARLSPGGPPNHDTDDVVIHLTAEEARELCGELATCAGWPRLVQLWGLLDHL